MALKVHSGGDRILLDESPTEAGEDAERTAWSRFGAENLERAYGDDEPEYTLEDLRPSGTATSISPPDLGPTDDPGCD